MKRLYLALILLVLATWPAHAQSPVTVIGPITANDCVKFNSTTIITDAGFICTGQGILPNATVSGTVLYFNGTAWVIFAGNTSGTNCLGENAVGAPQWTTCSGGSGANPGGSNTQIQYNASGTFGGIMGFTTNGTNQVTLSADNGNFILNDPAPNNEVNLQFQSSGTPYWTLSSGTATTANAFIITDNIAARTDLSLASNGNMTLMPAAPNTTVTIGSLATATSTAQPMTQIYKSETLSGIDTEGAQNAGLSVTVESNNTTHVGGGAPITQSNGIRSQAVQNGTGGAVAFVGIATGGADINGAFGIYTNVTATHFPGGAFGGGMDVFNSSGTNMPWSAFVPGTSSAAIGVDLATLGANLATAAVEMRGGASKWDVGVGAYGNSINTAFLEDDSSSVNVLNATGSHTNGINLGSATISAYAYKSTGFLVNGTGQIASVMPGSATNFYVCYNTSNGNFTYNGGNCSTSSKRFKHDIRPLTDTQPDPLDAVVRMRPVSFLYNEDQHTPGKQLGLIAEDVEAIDPRLVGYDKEGKPNSVRFDGPMIAYLIGAIKELKADNDNLRAEIRHIRLRNAAK